MERRRGSLRWFARNLAIATAVVLVLVMISAHIAYRWMFGGFSFQARHADWAEACSQSARTWEAAANCLAPHIEPGHSCSTCRGWPRAIGRDSRGMGYLGDVPIPGEGLPLLVRHTILRGWIDALEREARWHDFVAGPARRRPRAGRHVTYIGEGATWRWMSAIWPRDR